MRFSRAFSLTRGPKDDWFDPDLTVDTRLFLDPFLLLKAGASWGKAHDDLVAHFAHCYRLVAKAHGQNSLSAKAAHRLLTFPEPYEFALGYTAASTHGSGGGVKQARTIADGIAVAVAAGLDEPEHIEEIGILNEGFGADRGAGHCPAGRLTQDQGTRSRVFARSPRTASHRRQCRRPIADQAVPVTRSASVNRSRCIPITPTRIA